MGIRVECHDTNSSIMITILILPTNHGSYRTAQPAIASIEPQFWVLSPFRGREERIVARRRECFKRTLPTVKHPYGCSSVPFDKDTRREMYSSLQLPSVTG